MAAEEGKVDPMHQFQIEPMFGSGNWEIAGFNIAFTNSAFWMAITVILLWVFVYGGMKRELVPGRWQMAVESFTGFIDDMLEANRIILDTLKPENLGIIENSKIEGKVVIQKNAEIKNSTLRGPVIIGENCKIINSYIGPFTSVYFNTVIENSEIEHSIILENSKVKDVKRIADSLIGQNVEIVKSEKKPQAYRIMVGDSSRVEVI